MIICEQIGRWQRKIEVVSDCNQWCGDATTIFDLWPLQTSNNTCESLIRLSGRRIIKYMGCVQSYGSSKLPFPRAFANLSRPSRIGTGKCYVSCFRVHICRCHLDTKSLAWVLERFPYIMITYMGKTIINHPPVTIFIGAMVTIPTHGWFMALAHFIWLLSITVL